LDAKYDKADLPSIVKNNCVHLSTPHCNLLLALLLKFEELFDGTLGDWKLLPVSFELKKVLSRTMAGHTLFQKYTRPLS
jgi:hypothetical protein